MGNPFSNGNNLKLFSKIALKDSAVSPLLWCCGLISIPAFGCSYFASDLKSVAFFVLGFVILIAFGYAYFYLLFTNPNFLRSEGYQFKYEALSRFGDPKNPLDVNTLSVISTENHDKSINNPELPPPSESPSPSPSPAAEE